VQHAGRVEGRDDLRGIQIAHPASLADSLAVILAWSYRQIGRPPYSGLTRLRAQPTSPSTNRRNLAESSLGQEWLTPGISTSLAPFISASEEA
jgi:hypothetical protein